MKDQKSLSAKRRRMSSLSLIHRSRQDTYFRAAVQEATDAFNKMLQDFGYTQKLEVYDPIQHETHPPPQHSLLQ